MYRQALDYLREWKTRSLREPLVIRGARQVGKSYLVRRFSELEFSNLLELNLEFDPTDASLFMNRKPDQTVALLEAKYQVRITPGETLLFLDEIQAVPELLAALRYFHEQLPGLHVIAAGSLLDFALSNHRFSMPVGRIEYLHLGPMNFDEFLLALGHERLLDYLRGYQVGQDLLLHEDLIKRVKQYWMVGGMPEAVAAFARDQNYRDCERIKQTLLATYRDDFAKYGSRVKLPVLGKVFSGLPRQVGRKFVYTNVDRDIRHSDIKAAFEQLCLARVAQKVCHSDADGVPLGAQARERHFKALFLDVGLLCRACGVGIVDLESAKDITLVNSGAVAEQFVGQHLLHEGEFCEEPALHCWMRQKASSNAEVDYLLTMGQQVIPIEVKAGKTGTLKSLHLFVSLKQRDVALRFNAAAPSVVDIQTNVPSCDRQSFRLLSLPFYLIGQTRRLCTEAMAI